MSLTFILLTLVEFLAIGYSNPIIGGEDVGQFQEHGEIMYIFGKDKYSFMTYLTIYEIILESRTEVMHTCGGVIISENAVLTAAHCLDSSITVPIVFVRVGIINLEKEKEHGQLEKMISYQIHPKYVNRCPITKDKDEFCLNDLAILWVKNSFVFGPYVQKAILSKTTEILSNIGGWIIGWGIDETGQPKEMLQEAFMEIVPIVECQVTNWEVVINSNMICLLSKKKNSAPCLGDSGGPFVINGVVYGISSFNAEFSSTINSALKCNPTVPAVYTNIGHYAVWINTQLLLPPLPLKLPTSKASFSNIITIKKKTSNLKPPEKINSKKSSKSKYLAKGNTKKCSTNREKTL